MKEDSVEKEQIFIDNILLMKNVEVYDPVTNFGKMNLTLNVSEEYTNLIFKPQKSFN